MKNLGFVALIFFLLVTGCASLKENSKETNPTLPLAFEGIDSLRTSIGLLKWEEYFQDENLKSLIRHGLVHNQDNRIALERITASRAGMKAAKAAIFPAVSGIAGASQRKFGDYTMDGVGNWDTNRSETIPDDKRIPNPYKDFILGANFSWELDVWGKLKSRRKAATARFLASEQTSHAVRTMLVAEIAKNYYELLAVDQELQVLTESIQLQQTGLELMIDLKMAGKANQLAIDQFEALLLNSKSKLEANRRVQKSLEYELSRLVGDGNIKLTRSNLNEVIEMPRLLAVGIPANLLQNRPDLRAAELELKASQADVSAAKSAFFPSISLFGMAGFNAFEFSRLFFQPASTAYQLGAGLTAPIFNRREIQKEYMYAKADQKIAFLEYEKKTLNAYLEVLDLVNQIKTYENQMKLKAEEVEVQKRSVDNSYTLFTVGYANYLEVINAQSRALESAVELADLKASKLQSHALLYRALGGGME